MVARRWTADRAADTLWTAAIVFGATAVAARLWPTAPRVPSLSRAIPAAPAIATPASFGDPRLVRAVVQSNVFAVGHVAPRTRWNPPPVDTLPPGLAPDPAAAAALAGVPMSAPGFAAPRFYGTVIDARGASALLALGHGTVTQLYREGERAGGWRVVRVAPDRVLLATPDGERLTLRLPRDATSAPDTTTPPVP